MISQWAGCSTPPGRLFASCSRGKQLAWKVSLTTPGMIEYLHIVKDNIFRDKKLRGDGARGWINLQLMTNMTSSVSSS